MKKENWHDKHTKRISLKPRIIGLENISLSTGEANIFEENQIISQPDGLAFDPTTRTIWNIEYKCSNKQGNQIHGKAQLKAREAYLREIFKGWEVKNLYISGDYKVMRL